MDPNYMDWKRNLDIILTIQCHKMILTKSYPIEMIEETNKEAYIAWKKFDEVMIWFEDSVIYSDT